MKFLVAGFGSIGRRHFRNLLALGEHDIIVYRTHRSTLPVDELKDFRVETDLDAALALHPDGLIVANPTALHLDVAIPAAKAGCSIMMEKPVSDSLNRMDELQAALQVGGGQMLVGFHYRQHPALQLARGLLQQGAIGKPLSARVEWGEYLPGWHPWEDYRNSYAARRDLGGGVVRTLSHPLDYLRWLMGEVEAVTATTAKLSDLEIDVEDTAEITLHFADGSMGQVHLDYYRQPGTHEFEILGTQGSMRWNNADGGLAVFRSGSGGWETFAMEPGFERNDLFISEMRHFIAVCKGEEAPICTLEDGIRAQELVEAVFQSSEQGRRLNCPARIPLG